MPEGFDLLLRRGTLVSHDGIGEADVAIRNGRIAAIGSLSVSEHRRSLGREGAC